MNRSGTIRDKGIFAPLLGKGGMTLLEVLLAMVMLAAVVAMVSVSLSGSFAVVEATRNQGELYYRAQVALQRISEDITSAVLLSDIEFTGDREEIGAGRADSLTFASTAHVVFDDKDDHPGLAMISYRVEEDPANTGELVLLRSDRLLTPSDGDEEAVVPEGDAFMLCDRLRSVSFIYYDETGEEADAWSTETENTGQEEDRKLPVSVGCTLEFWIDQEAETSIAFTTRILIPAGLINAP